MTKHFFALFCVIQLSLSAQLPVSTVPQNKKAIIEHYTALKCGYSPEADSILNTVYNSNPGNVVLINIHSGPYAFAAPDFTTIAGNGIAGMPGMGLNSWPSADFNRTIVTGAAMSNTVRTQWANYTSSITSLPAYCNVALQGTVDVTTRALTVDVQVYYTSSSPAATNSLTVLLLEDSIHGPEENWTNSNLINYNPDMSYNHNHVLRRSITPVFGTTIPTTSSGTTYSTTLSYTIPATYGAVGKSTPCLLGRIKLAAFVTETNTLTINGTYGPVFLQNFASTYDLSSYTLTPDPFVCEAKLNSMYRFINNGSMPVTSAVFSYSVNGGTPGTFTYSGAPVNPMTASQVFSLPTLSFAPVSINTVVIDVNSVSGNADQNSLNNSITRTVPTTTIVAGNLNMQMKFNQDQWGSDIGWTLEDETTGMAVPGASIAVGTYTDLATSGTLLHVHSFTVNPSSCYKLKVTDKTGDGVDAGFGVGGYTLTAGTSSIIVSNGIYGRGESKWFRSASSTFVSNNEASETFVKLYPNPAYSKTALQVFLHQNELMNIGVINEIGQTIYSEQRALSAGTNSVELPSQNWASGLYTVMIHWESKTEKLKLEVVR
jgi:hypothetical protein